MTQPAIFEMSPDTRLLRQHLRMLRVGQVATYAELTDIISKPVNGSSSNLQSAVRSLLHGERIVFAAIRGLGLRRLSDTEITSAADQDVAGIRRRAKKAARKLTAVADFGAMPKNIQMQHTARLSLLAMVAASTTDRAVAAVEKVCHGRASELPIRETIKALGLVPA